MNRSSKVFIRNGNDISTPNKYGKQNNYNNYNNNNDDNLQEENRKLKMEISIKNKELEDVKKTFNNLQKQLNELKRKSANKRSNNNYSNNNNVHYNNYIRNNNRISSNVLNDSFDDFNDPFFGNFFSNIANPFIGRSNIRGSYNRNFNSGDYMSDDNFNEMINQFH